MNLKCQTLPILSLRSQYSRNFHLYVFCASPQRDKALTQLRLQLLARLLGGIVS
jgi:hypothetical protein